MTFAKDTLVSVERSRAELDTLLAKHGATQRILGTDEDAGVACAMFTIDRRQVRVRVPLPTLGEATRALELARGSDGWTTARRFQWVEHELQQRNRTRWRTLLLLTKAKLEAVELGITTIEREFLADVALVDGRTVHEAIAADIHKAYSTGTMPSLLGTGER